jgi:hypothetical protein
MAMMMRRTTLIALLVFALAVGAVDAQEAMIGSYTGEVVGQGKGLAGPGQPDIGVIALDPVKVGRPVVNAPYHAEAVTEITQVLADGNRIEQRTSATVARDSRGRTRREQQGIALGSFLAQGSQPIVTITDPATGMHITLNYEQKVAYRVKPPRLTSTDADAAATVDAAPPLASRSGGVSQGPPPKFETRPFPEPVIDPVAIEPSAGQPVESAVAVVPFEGAARTERLESTVIEGLRADGTRTTMTFPAGTMGNSLPIEVISERWYSPELQVVLLTRRSDPRFGETVYRLIDIDRSEPAPELFKVPPGFRTKDMRPGTLMPLQPEGE